jgi:hypothetical protein
MSGRTFRHSPAGLGPALGICSLSTNQVKGKDSSSGKMDASLNPEVPFTLDGWPQKVSSGDQTDGRLTDSEE